MPQPKIEINKISWFKRFFINYFWVGLVIILLAVVVDAYSSTHTFWLDVLTKTLEAVGIAVLVASIFTFASGTSEFVNKIQRLLQNIVIHRNFLSNIDSESKRRALAALIKPNELERQNYANLEDYYDVFISKTLDITKKCVRSDYAIRARVFNDIEKGRLGVIQDISYRVHPTKDGYDTIQLKFYDSEDLSQLSFCEYIAISSPGGDRKVYNQFEWNDASQGGEPWRGTKINLDDFGINQLHLNVDMRVVEYGYDHWIPVGWRAGQPTDGFSFFLRCEEGIKLKNFMTFVSGANFHIENRNNSEIHVTSHQWFNEGTGISIVAGIDEAVSNNAVDDTDFSDKRRIIGIDKPDNQ